VNIDTNQWCLQNRKGEPSQKPKPSMKFSDKVPKEISSDTVLMPGDLFVFPMEINEENLLPFGMGCVIEHESKGFIHFQWMSNFNQNQLAKFLPMWFQPSDKRLTTR
jgi:hypothetical protein